MDAEQLHASIDSAIRQAALSPDMFEALQAELVQGRNAMRREAASAKSVASLDATNRKQADTISNLKSQIATLQADAQSVSQADTAKLVAEAKADTLKDCFGLVFRNAEVRKAVFDDVPLAMTYGDHSHVEHHAHTTKTTEEQT